VLSTLSVSQSGLNAAKIAVENVSNNIANENTVGYKKRVVQLSELEQMNSGFTGRGVSADNAYRITSQYMYDKLISENSKLSYYSKSSSMLSSVEAIFKETTNSGLSSDLNRYYQSVENLRTNPNSQVYKTALQNQGTVLVESLQNLYTSVENQQKSEKSALYTNVGDVNDTLKQIGIINEKIGKYGETNDLLDKRDQLESELSNYADISVSRDNGFYELKISGQTAISNNTNVKTLNIVEENTVQKDKFNYTKFNTVTNTTDIYDPLKYNEDFTLKTTNAFDTNDVVTYKLNNEFEVSVTYGESLSGDWDNDINTANTTQTVNNNNLTRALALKINANSNMKDLVTAYNGDYSIDANGNKITDNSKDNYLRIESKFGGIANQFDGRISIEKRGNLDSTIIDSRESIYRNDSESSDAESRIYLAINEREVPLKSGILKAQVENLSSDSPTNKFQVYLDKLDAFAQTLADISEKYIKTSSGEYIYGEAASDESKGVISSTGLFSGSSIKTLKFNENLVNDLTQDKLDYLATIQWKTDISYGGKGQLAPSNQKSSLLEFYRDIKVNVSADRENINFSKDTQSNVKMSIQSSYNQLTKVDKDEEMLDLMKFQAAYTANAKIVTVLDEMLQTLLGLKR
jgi:flagellar hook-associated protein 1 FlgK